MAINICRSLVALWAFSSTLYAVASTWSVETSVDPASYQTVSLISQESINSISDEYGVKEVKPLLEFRCQASGGNAVRVRINWLRFISSFNTEVTFVTGDRKPLTLKLGVDRSNKVTATRGAEDDQAILAALSGQQMLKVRVTPYSEVPVEVQFDIAELDAGLELLTRACDAAS